MDFFTNLALRNRLLWFLMAVIAGCFALASGYFAHQEHRAIGGEIRRDTLALARILEANVAAPMLYGAEEVAEEMLAATFGGQPYVTRALLFSSDSSLFADYFADPGLDTAVPPLRSEGDFAIDGGHHHYIPMHLDGGSRPVGMLFIETRTDLLWSHMQRYFAVQGAMLLLVLGAAFGFGSRLQRAISEPYKRQAEDMEQRIARRTQALREANQRLSSEVAEREQAQQLLLGEKQAQQELIGELKRAQRQLLQSEKMASVGQLAAGVAHEINNPVGFISSNLNTLNRYVEGLIGIVDAYQQADPVLQGHETLRLQIEMAKSKGDFDYLKEDVVELLRESDEGVQRVKKIVQDLKDFSRADNQEQELADLHKGLDSTLNVAWNEIKYKAEVVKEYGELPPLLCSPLQLNQVFMNLLINAAHAIGEKGTITIRTGCEAERIWVEVADTGSGITPEDQQHLFEPFFTTKPVGKGTGLGLSVSYGIVEKHGGEIEVESSPGQGSRFRVWLPVGPQSTA